MTVVISLGGSVISDGSAGNYVDSEKVKKYAVLLLELSQKEKLGVVVGGGRLARDRIAKARSKGKSEVWCDWEAIEATKHNAQLFINALGGDVNPEPFNDFIQATEYLKQHNIVVMFGTIPGITTDTDAVLLGEHLGSQRFVNISNVDGVWDEEKKTIEQMDHERLVKMAVVADKRRAGEHFIIDTLAAKLLARSNIEARFVNGANIDDVKKAILGEHHKGTIVRD